MAPEGPTIRQTGYLDTLSGVCVTVLVLCSHVRSLDAQRQQYEIGVLPRHYEAAMAAARTVAPAGGSALNLTVIPSLRSKTLYEQTVEMHAVLSGHDYSAILAPFDPTIAMVTDDLQIPYLVTDYGQGLHSSVFYMVPDPGHVVSCILSIVDAYQWRKVAILSEDHTDPKLLNDMLRNPDIDLRVFELDQGNRENDISQYLRKLRELGIREILIVARPDVTRAILRQGHRLSIIAEPYSWILVNLGSENIDDDLLTDLYVNITSVHLVRSAPAYAPSASPESLSDPASLASGTSESLSATETALVYDGLHVLQRTAATITSGQTWLSQIRNISLTGYTGTMEFDSHGMRTNFQLRIFAFNFSQNAYDQVGQWDESSSPGEPSLKFYDRDLTAIQTPDLPLANKLSRVVSICEPPWVMLKSDHEERQGNERFEGFVVDFLDALSTSVQLNYELYMVHDGNFGAQQENGEWNGIVGEILAGNATMSVAPLSVNAERESAIDFTKPFKTRGITVLIQTPESKSSYFEFLSPLSYQVWVGVLMAMFIMSVLLYFFERFSMSQRRDMPKLNATESFWFVWGSIVSGSTESAPVTVSGRILTSAWWFFAMILISTYTANLAAFLTVQKMIPPIKDVADLAGQSKITYGTVRDSGVAHFFQNTRIQPFQKMWEHMKLFPESMVNSTDEGLERVRKGDYAFLWDDSVNGYLAATDCVFTEIGPSFDPKGFGIGLPPGSSYRDQLSLAILQLGDQGVISELEHKWWLSSTCPDYRKPTIASDETEELQMENVAGIFFVLALGVAAGLVACLIDVMLQRKVKQLKEQKKLKESNKANNIAGDKGSDPSPRTYSCDRPLANTSL